MNRLKEMEEQKESKIEMISSHRRRAQTAMLKKKYEDDTQRTRSVVNVHVPHTGHPSDCGKDTARFDLAAAAAAAVANNPRFRTIEPPLRESGATQLSVEQVNLSEVISSIYKNQIEGQVLYAEREAQLLAQAISDPNTN